jgi:hypothetical protein
LLYFQHFTTDENAIFGNERIIQIELLRSSILVLNENDISSRDNNLILYRRINGCISNKSTVHFRNFCRENKAFIIYNGVLRKTGEGS